MTGEAQLALPLTDVLRLVPRFLVIVQSQALGVIIECPAIGAFDWHCSGSWNKEPVFYSIQCLKITQLYR